MSETCLLLVEGVLDSTTYLLLRDTVIKAALDEPSAVIVDVTALSVTSPSAWAVFTSARWHVSVWPDVPVLLVCPTAAGRDTVRRAGITRYVPVFATLDEAIADLSVVDRRSRHRATAELPAVAGSVITARTLVTEWLTQWSCSDFIAAARTVATALVENAVGHCDGPAVLRAETNGATVTVAVSDSSTDVPVRHEADTRRRGISGLDFIDAVTQTWGHTPTATGKVVWAVIGRENCL